MFEDVRLPDIRVLVFLGGFLGFFLVCFVFLKVRFSEVDAVVIHCKSNMTLWQTL